MIAAQPRSTHRRLPRHIGAVWMWTVIAVETMLAFTGGPPGLRVIVSVVFVFTVPGSLLLDLEQPRDLPTKLILGIGASLATHLVLVSTWLVPDPVWIGAAIAAAYLGLRASAAFKGIVARNRDQAGAPPANVWVPLPARTGTSDAGADLELRPGDTIDPDDAVSPGDAHVASLPPSEPPAQEPETHSIDLPDIATVMGRRQAAASADDAEGSGVDRATPREQAASADSEARPMSEPGDRDGPDLEPDVRPSDGLDPRIPDLVDPTVSDDEHDPSDAGEGVAPDPAPRPAVTLEAASPPLDINVATVQDLVRLPGVGEALASRIVEERQTGGPFVSPVDLLRVAGIGAGRLSTIESDIVVHPRTHRGWPERSTEE